MSEENTFFTDDVKAQILEKARQDTAFKKMLFDDPQQALNQFGIVIPIASSKNYLETVYAMYDRAEFYQWYNTEILNEFRDETITMAPGLCVTATEHEDVAWDFEVTSYVSK